LWEPILVPTPVSITSVGGKNGYLAQTATSEPELVSGLSPHETEISER
jgi:hypothetical protein